MQAQRFESPTDYVSQIENSDEYQSGKAKEKPLNIVVKTILEDFGLKYSDLTSHNNFVNSTEKHEADYLIPQLVVIENKNWDCYNYKGYTVTMLKAKTEIFSRFTPYLQHPLKILIIGKPRWGVGVKRWLESNGITIIEVGYQIKKENLQNAYIQLKRSLSKILICGYPDIYRLKTNITRVFGYFITSIKQLLLFQGFCTFFYLIIKCKFRLKSHRNQETMDLNLQKHNVNSLMRKLELSMEHLGCS